MQATQEQVTQASVSTRYATMEREDFGPEIDRAWKAAQDVVGVIKEHVEASNLRPIDGIKVISCLTGSLFGYEDFHPRSGQNPLSDLLYTSPPLAGSDT
jgi:hypothetical protein